MEMEIEIGRERERERRRERESERDRVVIKCVSIFAEIANSTVASECVHRARHSSTQAPW